MGRTTCLGFALLTALAVGGLRWPLAWVVLGLGAVSMAWAWRSLKR
jgi:chromate transporter